MKTGPQSLIASSAWNSRTQAWGQSLRLFPQPAEGTEMQGHKDKFLHLPAEGIVSFGLQNQNFLPGRGLDVAGTIGTRARMRHLEPHKGLVGP